MLVEKAWGSKAWLLKGIMGEKHEETKNTSCFRNKSRERNEEWRHNVVYKGETFHYSNTKTNTDIMVQSGFYIYIYFICTNNSLPLQAHMNERKRNSGALVQRARREEFMWMWEKYTTLLHWSFITEGKQGPPQSLPHHHKYER